MKNRRKSKVVFAILLLLAVLTTGCYRTGGDPVPDKPAAQSGQSHSAQGASQSQSAGTETAELPVRGTDVTEPREGCVFVEVSGSFEKPDPALILERLNEIRREACEEGIMNPTTGEPLTMEDYTALQWSPDLERTAMLRAAEASVVEDHVRPNGEDCFSVAYGGLAANYEALAWGYETILDAVNGWYTEKEAYTEETGEVAAHYIALITPENVFVGAAAFTPLPEDSRPACAAEFSMAQQMPDAEQAAGFEYGPCRQTIEIVKH